MRLRRRTSRGDKPPVDDKDRDTKRDQERNESGPAVKVIPIARVTICNGDHSAENQAGPYGGDLHI